MYSHSYARMEELTLFLTKAYGIYFTAMGFTMLIYFRELQEAVEEFAMSKMLFYLSGNFFFIIGVLAVLAHTVFSSVLASIISVVGYLILAKGLLILLLPHRWIAAAAGFLNVLGWYIVSGTLFMLFGGGLLFIAYLLPLIV